MARFEVGEKVTVEHRKTWGVCTVAYTDDDGSQVVVKAPFGALSVVLSAKCHPVPPPDPRDVELALLRRTALDLCAVITDIMCDIPEGPTHDRLYGVARALTKIDHDPFGELPFSLHVAPCPRSDPDPNLSPAVACTCRREARTEGESR